MSRSALYAFASATTSSPRRLEAVLRASEHGDENEEITFGFFDGTLDELRASQGDGEYDERRSAADELVESVGADGVYEVIEDRSLE